MKPTNEQLEKAREIVRIARKYLSSSQSDISAEGAAQEIATALAESAVPVSEDWAADICAEMAREEEKNAKELHGSVAVVDIEVARDDIATALREAEQ